MTGPRLAGKTTFAQKWLEAAGIKRGYPIIRNSVSG